MKYYTCDRYEDHWSDIIHMIDENYAHDYEDDTCLILSANLILDLYYKNKTIPNHKRKIVYQLEPLIEDHWWNLDDIINSLREYDEVWDYDLDNIKILKEHGIDAKFRPFLYTEGLKRIENKDNPDIDVLFYGTPTIYRHDILYNLIRLQLPYYAKFVSVNNICGEMLDEFISRSKIILDLSTVKSPLDRIQKQSRIFYSLINDKCVITEKNKRNYFSDLVVEVDSGRSIQETASNLGSTITEYLHNEKWKDYSNVSEKFKNFTFYDFVHNYASGSELVDQSTTDSNIIILYHIQQIGEWEKLYQDQINSLIISGLYDAAEKIFIGINGHDDLPFVLDKMTYFYNKRLNTTGDTLEYVWNFCTDNPHINYSVLYFHSMGVTHRKSNSGFYLQKNAWRIYLEYFTIHKWKTCVNDLNEYDCVGVEWKERSGLVDENGEFIEQANPHYSGEFWWAKSEYIRKLDPEYLYNNEHGWERFRSEFWIGTKDPKYKCYHSSGTNLYNLAYFPNYYINQ